VDRHLALAQEPARKREAERACAAPPTGAAKRPQLPQAMVRCAHCGLHLPATDALPGKDGGVLQRRAPSDQPMTARRNALP
jgi:hypothetical protein